MVLAPEEAISGLEDEVALGTGDQDLDLMLFLLAVQGGIGSYCVILDIILGFCMLCAYS